MLFTIGIEHPTNEEEAFGITVPVFNKFNLGCNSAADTRADILVNAKEAILMAVEEIISDGQLIDELDDQNKDYRAENEGFTEWMALEVNVDSFTEKQKRINITMAEPFLARVDDFVSHNPAYRDRSDFLTKAADSLMSSER